MGETEKYARTLQRREGWLCLDFANTAEWHASNQPTEHLQTYADLVVWAQTKGILTAQEAETLLQEAQLRPDAAAAVLCRAIELREVIFRIVSAVVAGNSPPPADLAALNEALAEGNVHFQVVAGQEGFVWDWHTSADGCSPCSGLWCDRRRIC
jgi:predicted RNA-binding Zn ribbon-like protein